MVLAYLMSLLQYDTILLQFSYFCIVTNYFLN